jgi:serine/threonine-protein kinase RsbT
VSEKAQRVTVLLSSSIAPSNGTSIAIPETAIPIACDLDIIRARQIGRAEASKLGFSSTDLTLIATAISELARNIVMYAKQGVITVRPVRSQERLGIVVIARDQGPGMADIRQILQDGYSTTRSLGLGLPGVRRLMDEFEIESELGKGTVVVAKKWTLV